MKEQIIQRDSDYACNEAPKRPSKVDRLYHAISCSDNVTNALSSLLDDIVGSESSCPCPEEIPLVHLAHLLDSGADILGSEQEKQLELIGRIREAILT